MSAHVLLLTPPFTQLNTPYPATAYLKGFLNTKAISSFQADLGIEVMLKIFSKKGLTEIFELLTNTPSTEDENILHIIQLKDRYIDCVDAVVEFLQGKNPMLAHLICQRGFLPEASRFQQTEDLHWAFGSMGIQDKAKHLATLYLEDLSDLISDAIDPYFGFSRYAEKLGRSANTFDEMHEALQKPLTHIDQLSITCLDHLIKSQQPELLALSVPFPGNLYGAFRLGQWTKKHYPHIKVAMGGGFPNTELRSLKDPRVFDYIDFITLDDGEKPLENLLQYLGGQRDIHLLKRTFLLHQQEVVYMNGSLEADYKQADTGTPDYGDLCLDKYISVIEVANPMHRLWSDGVWNKLTMAHGCYWGKCTFCDISLDYIKNYEPLTAKILCDRMETLIQQTGNRGFHFVDEAAPPSLMSALALEILRRKLIVTWWTNVRFEKNFTEDLCLLLKASGCIAVSGGLEVASDRLLKLIDKGITVSQVATVTQAFSRAGIMVHAYLMYAFPTQTLQETIDSLEMVRQLFKAGVLESAFWHRFALTVHSPVGMNPEKFQVKIRQVDVGSFANNDLDFEDKLAKFNDDIGFGLKKSLFNYMHQIGLDEPLHKWFDFKVPQTSVNPNYIETCLTSSIPQEPSLHKKVYWLGGKPNISFSIKSKKGQQWNIAQLTVQGNIKKVELKMNEKQGIWLSEILNQLTALNFEGITWGELKKSYENQDMEDDFELFWFNKIRKSLLEMGLIVL